MDIKQVKTLIELFNNSNLTVLEVSDKDNKIKIEKNVTTVTSSSHSNTVIPSISNTNSSQGKDAYDFNNTKEIRSPIVGVFYAAPNETAKPFISKGDKIKKGDVVCIIETMKMLNEIVSDYDGEVIDICANNGDVIEFSQVLVKLI